jgi:hypothetical protein
LTGGAKIFPCAIITQTVPRCAACLMSFVLFFRHFAHFGTQ